MKNTTNVKRFYAMSLVDGRIVFATRELLTNSDYRIVSKDVAVRVESKAIDWRDVAFALRQQDNLDQNELLKRAEQAKVQNLRRSVVTRENVEQFETRLSDADVGKVFDGDGLPSVGASMPETVTGVAPVPRKLAKKPAKKPSASETTADRCDGMESIDL